MPFEILGRDALPICNALANETHREYTTEIDFSGKALTVLGNNATLDAGNAGQFFFGDGDVVGLGPATSLELRDLVLVNGTVDTGGGAIAAGGAVSVVLRRTRFAHNTAGTQGGAVLIEQGRLEVTDSTFVANSADRGGAVYAEGGATVAIENSGFAANAVAGSEASGGAVAAYGSTVVVRGCQFGTNAAASQNAGGGAIFVSRDEDHPSPSTLVVNASRFDGNAAAGTRGGAIYATSAADIRLHDAVFSGNTADAGGGALFFGFNASGIVHGGSFGPGGHGGKRTDDVARIDLSRDVIFECPDGQTGQPVTMKLLELADPPPAALRCSAR